VTIKFVVISTSQLVLVATLLSLALLGCGEKTTPTPEPVEAKAREPVPGVDYKRIRRRSLIPGAFYAESAGFSARTGDIELEPAAIRAICADAMYIKIPVHIPLSYTIPALGSDGPARYAHVSLSGMKADPILTALEDAADDTVPVPNYMIGRNEVWSFIICPLYKGGMFPLAEVDVVDTGEVILRGADEKIIACVMAPKVRDLLLEVLESLRDVDVFEKG